MDQNVLVCRTKISADINATISTLGVWSSITAMSWMLGGTSEAPVTAATICTVVIWALRKMQ